MTTTAPAMVYSKSRPSTLLVFREPINRDRSPQRPEDVSNWESVHAHLVALGKNRAAHERDLCRSLLAAESLRVHMRAGYASLREYAERVIGLSGRQTEERLRVGRALAELPLLDAALAAGELPWSAVRELTRIATPETEHAWMAWAKPRRVQQIEKAVASRRQGDRPQDRPDPSLVKHRLAFEVKSETMAFRDLQAAVRADLGHDVDDDTLLYEVARRALGGPSDDGRASYQVAITKCDECGRAGIDAAGESHPLDCAVAAMAACDAQELATVASARVPSPRVGADRPARERRASQTVPPATRRAVMRRDRKHCVVPGCNNHRFLDVHHLDPRSEGGGHDPDRLAVLCGAHHRAVHGGAIQIGGTGTTGFRVQHGDGTPYGVPVSPHAVDVVRQVIGALENMGFKPTRARALLDAALRSVAPRDPAVVLRAALHAS